MQPCVTAGAYKHLGGVVVKKIIAITAQVSKIPSKYKSE